MLHHENIVPFDPERFFDLIPDPVCIASTDGSFKKINAAWERVLGYTTAEILSIPFFDLIHPDDREQTRKDLRQQARLKIIRFVNRYRTKSGDYRWLEWNATPGDGDLVYATARDITGRIEAEEQIRLWADTFTYCAHGIAIGIPSTKRIMTCNPAFAAMHGMSIDEVSGLHFFDLYPESEHERVSQKIAELKQKGVIRFEATRLKKDGSRFPVQMDIVNISDDEGNLLYHITTVQDITERKKVEVALRESEKRFRSVVESAPEAIFIQAGGCFVYLNPAAISLFGASSEEALVGRAVLDMVHPDFRTLVGEHMRLLNEERRSLPALEKRLLRCDGTSVDAEISAVPFTHESMQGALVFVRDITARKKAEEERLQLEIQLFQSHKMESIGQLAGGIAHDLNNLLTPILGYSEMMQEQLAGDESLQEAASVIHQASLSARTLIWKLLEFSRSRSLEYRSMDLNEVVKGFEHLLRRTLREDITISYILFEETLPVQADSGQLEQILMNLSVNAQDAMPYGGQVLIETDKVIEQEPLSELTPGAYARITVSDSGEGIDGETLTHIFEPFFTTKERGHGTGFGLATVYSIVKQHKGFIRVFSEPGKGTQFKIWLPLFAAETVMKNDEVKQCIAEKPEGSILVVEDNDQVRRFVVKTLERQGHAVLAASGGAEALELLDELQICPDLLVTDVVMPGMNGRELAEKIRMIHSDIKVLYMSGYAGDIISSQGVLDEGIDFLEKPFSMQVLVAKVTEMLCR